MVILNMHEKIGFFGEKKMQFVTALDLKGV